MRYKIQGVFSYELPGLTKLITSCQQQWLSVYFHILFYVVLCYFSPIFYYFYFVVVNALKIHSTLYKNWILDLIYQRGSWAWLGKDRPRLRIMVKKWGLEPEKNGVYFHSFILAFIVPSSK